MINKLSLVFLFVVINNAEINIVSIAIMTVF